VILFLPAGLGSVWAQGVARLRSMVRAPAAKHRTAEPAVDDLEVAR